MTPSIAVALFLALLAAGLAAALTVLNRRLRSTREELDRIENERRVVVQFLNRLGEAMTRTTDLDEMLRMILRFGIEATDAQGGALFLLYRRRRILLARVTEGTFPPLRRPTHTTFTKILSKARYIEEALRHTPYPIDDGVLGEVVSTRQPVLIEDASLDERLPKYEEPELELRTLLAVPLVFRDEVLGVLTVVNKRSEPSFHDTDRSLLASLAEQAAVSVEGARVYRAAADRERIDRDLQMAREVQQILIPREIPRLPGLDCAGLSEPAQQVGGDYYDVFALDGGRLAFAIADVSGKGVSAGLVMAMFRATLRSHAMTEDSPAEVLRQVNRQVFPDIRDDMFVSVLYGILDLDAGRVVFARAGHEAPLLRRASGEVEIIASPGMAVGIDPGDAFEAVIADREIDLPADDLLVLYTDGITEARDRVGNEFGRDGLVDAVATSGTAGAAQMVEDVRERIRRFAGDTPQMDDITLLVLGRKNRNERESE